MSAGNVDSSASSDRRKASRGGSGSGLPSKDFQRGPESHAERAAELLRKAREARAKAEKGQAIQSGKNVIKVAQGNATDASDVSNTPIPLPTILKSLANPALGASAFSVKDGIPIAGKLVRARLNTQTRLAHLNNPVLEEAGIASELERHRIMVAFGVKALSNASVSGGSGNNSLASSTASKTIAGARKLQDLQPQAGPSSPAKKRRRMIDDEALSREYGNVKEPSREPGLGGEIADYVFHEILKEDELHGRFAHVNRAPIMTAWTTIVLERLGFQRREALSISHCYVNTTSTARGISLGIIPASERDRSVNKMSANQPHFELMGVKVPLMKLGGHLDEWRGISKGDVVSPDAAFNYMRRSMYQTLPVVMGALMLLADSYVNATNATAVSASPDEIPSPDLLHAKAYDLYTQFRPETAGEWGKKSEFFCSKALSLRFRHQVAGGDGNDDDKGKVNVKSESNPVAIQADELRAFQQELQAFSGGVSVKAEQDNGPGHLSAAKSESSSVKQE